MIRISTFCVSNNWLLRKIFSVKISLIRFLKNALARPLFIYFRYFHTIIYAYFSTIQTRIVRVEE